MRQRSCVAGSGLCACAVVLASGCAERMASSAQPAPDSTPYLTGPRARADAATPPMEPVAAAPAEAPPTPGHAPIALFGYIAGEAGASDHDPSENLRQVSFAEEGGDTDPAVAPDGARIYYASTAHRATPDIYVKSVAGRAVTQLTNDAASDIMPAVSPDGSRVAFASDRSGSWDIYVMNATGGRAVQVTSDATHELHPTWSPDGRTLAFCRLGEVSGRWEIWITDAENAGVQKFLTLGLFPDWHPSASRILFQRSRDRGDRLFSVWTLDYAGGEATNLTEIATAPDAALINPKWSPDGDYVAFASVPNPGEGLLDSRPESADIWIMNVKGGGLANLTGGRFTNLMPTWGADRNLYFVSDRDGRDNLWAVNPQSAVAAALKGSNPNLLGAGSQPPAAPAAATPTVQAMTPKAPARVSAKPAPAQTEPDPPAEIANVPIDDRER